MTLLHLIRSKLLEKEDGTWMKDRPRNSTADLCILPVHPVIIKGNNKTHDYCPSKKVLKQDLRNKLLTTTTTTKLTWLFPLRDLLDVSLEIPANIFVVFFYRMMRSGVCQANVTFMMCPMDMNFDPWSFSPNISPSDLVVIKSEA